MDAPVLIFEDSSEVARFLAEYFGMEYEDYLIYLEYKYDVCFEPESGGNHE